MRIVQMTSVHPWNDTRLFLKMSASVAAAGHEVHLVVPRAGGPAVEEVSGVTIHAVASSANRRDRMIRTVSRVLDLAGGLRGDLYQFHDPEFLLRAVGFQEKTGKPVVFDSHEDYRLQAMYKVYVPGWLRPAVGRTVGAVEDRTVSRLAGVIAATPSIAERFQGHRNCIVVQNFPVKAEFALSDGDASGRRPDLFGFVGSLSEVRGVVQMVAALEHAGRDLRLDLGGVWSPESLRNRCVEMPGWAQVNELGFLERRDIREMFSRVSAGLVLLHPVQSYLTAYPVKMFEYMAAGLPVIASDFPLWRSIIQEADCGLLVDPLDTSAIGRAMRTLADDPGAAVAMGHRGRRAVETRFNWEKELEKLLPFYERLAAV